jgi:hypothetical protein
MVIIDGHLGRPAGHGTGPCSAQPVRCIGPCRASPRAAPTALKALAVLGWPDGPTSPPCSCRPDYHSQEKKPMKNQIQVQLHMKIQVQPPCSREAGKPRHRSLAAAAAHRPAAARWPSRTAPPLLAGHHALPLAGHARRRSCRRKGMGVWEERKVK